MAEKEAFYLNDADGVGVIRLPVIRSRDPDPFVSGSIFQNRVPDNRVHDESPIVHYQYVKKNEIIFERRPDEFSNLLVGYMNSKKVFPTGWIIYEGLYKVGPNRPTPHAYHLHGPRYWDLVIIDHRISGSVPNLTEWVTFQYKEINNFWYRYLVDEPKPKS